MHRLSANVRSFATGVLRANRSSVGAAQTHLTHYQYRGFMRAPMGSKYSVNMGKIGVMGQTQIRSFSLPDHIKLEMPNLSPTMEKVS